MYGLFVLLGVVSSVSAVLSGRHLLFDGAYFFLRIIATGRMDTSDTFRLAHHAIVHGPLALSVRLGVDDLRLLSLIFGGFVFGAPLLLTCYATRRLIDGDQPGLALVSMSGYVVSTSFAGLFIVSESHLAFGVFYLTLAILRCADLSNARELAGLVALSLVAMLCYESWAIFAPICLALLVRRTKLATRGLRFLASMYVVVLAVNGAAIFKSSHAPNRDALIASTLRNGVVFVALVAAFGVLAASALGLLPRQRKKPPTLERKLRTPARTAKSAAIHTGVALWAALVGWCAFEFVAPISAIYALRSVNVFVPVAVAGAVYRTLTTTTSGECPRVTRFVAVLATLVFAAQFRHTVEWLRYTDSFVSLLAERRGYVSSDMPPRIDHHYQSSWTDPVLSLALQGIHGRPLRSVMYNPAATWQPFGPPLCQSPEAIALRYGMPIDSLVASATSNCPRGRAP